MTTENEKDEFSQALEGVLDNTEMFRRHEWAELLGTTEEVIRYWITGTDIPRSSHIFMIMSTLQNSTNIPLEPIDAFMAMAKKPALDVSPKHGGLMLPTVDEYMNRPTFSELGNTLAKLSKVEQDTYLRGVYSSEKKENHDV